jgi:hypothetical protein
MWIWMIIGNTIVILFQVCMGRLVNEIWKLGFRFEWFYIYIYTIMIFWNWLKIFYVLQWKSYFWIITWLWIVTLNLIRIFHHCPLLVYNFFFDYGNDNYKINPNKWMWTFFFKLSGVSNCKMKKIIFYLLWHSCGDIAMVRKEIQ